MRVHLDRIPKDVSTEELIRRLNVIIDNLNNMLCEIDEDNFTDDVINKLKGDKS